VGHCCPGWGDGPGGAGQPEEKSEIAKIRTSGPWKPDLLYVIILVNSKYRKETKTVKKILFLMIVLVVTAVGCKEADVKTPVPGGGGAVTYLYQAPDRYLTWIAAFDEVTSRADLEYRVYYSKTAYSADTVDAVLAEGTPVSDWTKAATSWLITGATGGSNFYNVIVCDEAGNMACYISYDHYIVT
jgi:hypothetical protein